jgi:hypothetical protein
MKSSFTLAAMLLFSAGPAWSLWFGNPALRSEEGPSALSVIYDFGQRDTEGPAGTTGDMEFHRVYAEYSHAPLEGRDLEVFARATPFTGFFDLEGSSFDPNILHVGGGARLAFQPQDLPTFGLQASLDYSQGSEDDAGFDNDVTWMDLAIAAGASYPFAENVDLYVEANLEEDETIGAYIGLEYLPSPRWTLGAELHIINEQVVGIRGGYRF